MNFAKFLREPFYRAPPVAASVFFTDQCALFVLIFGHICFCVFTWNIEVEPNICMIARNMGKNENTMNNF